MRKVLHIGLTDVLKWSDLIYGRVVKLEIIPQCERDDESASLSVATILGI